MRSNLENIFYLSGVDLVMQAHVHCYERDAAIYQNLTVKSDVDS